MRIPKVGNILIPGIKKKIEKTLEKLKLKPEISIDNFLAKFKTKKHRYCTICESEEGKKVVFYSRLHFNLDAKEKVIREIKFLEKLKRSDLKIKEVVPEIIEWKIEKSFEWYLRNLSPGEPLGQRRILQQKLDKKIISKIAKIILEISKIPQDFIKPLKEFNVENYLAKKVYQELLKKKLLKRELVNSIQSFIEKNLSFLKKENKYFSHGDLNLGNLIYDGKKVFLIDWELIHINNFAFDIGYFWSHLWQAKKEIRRSLVQEYLKEIPKTQFEKFKVLFPIVTSFLALGGIQFKEEKKFLFNLRQRFYSKVFENFFNFEKLIKL